METLLSSEAPQFYTYQYTSSVYQTAIPQLHNLLINSPNYTMLKQQERIHLLLHLTAPQHSEGYFEKYVKIPCLFEHFGCTTDSACCADKVDNCVDSSLAHILDPHLNVLLVHYHTTSHDHCNTYCTGRPKPLFSISAETESVLMSWH